MMEVYLDNSATTKPAPAVVEVITKALTEEWYNPSALYRPALEAEKKLSAARETCLRRPVHLGSGSSLPLAVQRRIISPSAAICAAYISPDGC